jgi:hypothetical protein
VCSDLRTSLCVQIEGINRPRMLLSTSLAHHFANTKYQVFANQPLSLFINGMIFLSYHDIKHMNSFAAATPMGDLL